MSFAEILRLSVVIGIAGCIAVGYGQANKSGTKPDLSGTWVFDRDRSNVGKSKNAATPPEQIKITYSDPELKIHRTVFINGQQEEKEFAYYTDGRGETNPATVWITANPDPKSPRPAETKSKTSWSGEKIVTRSIFRSLTGTAIIEFQIIEEWRLSSDGKTLTQTTRTIAQHDPMSNSIFIPGNGRDFRAVYNLVSK
jgi:hypothetical protein